jgi:hypothetical protein
MIGDFFIGICISKDMIGCYAKTTRPVPKARRQRRGETPITSLLLRPSWGMKRTRFESAAGLFDYMKFCAGGHKRYDE